VVVVLVPVDVPAGHVVVDPGEQLQLLVERMGAIPLERVRVIEARSAQRVPELGRPAVHPEVVEHPVRADSADHALGVVPEVVVARDRRVPREIGGHPTEELVRPQVVGGERVVGLVAVGADVDPGERVVGEVGADVLAVGDRPQQGADLRLAAGVLAGVPRALDLALPLVRELPVRVDPGAVRRRRDPDAVVPLDRALGEQAVVRAGPVLVGAPARP
jgi:hypothetical protein